jgi:bacillolysin
MLDTTRGQGIETRDNQGKTQDATPVTLTDDNGIWGEPTDPKGQKNAIDAQYGSQMTYDFYKDVLGRDSIDGKGQKLDSVVNTRLVDERGELAPNAFWDGQKMTYGIGDGRMFGDLTAMDVTGHEISHGVTQATAGLIYRNESGGINESLSDIMGTGVEWYASKKNPNIQSNFEIGEDSFTPGRAGDALRYMDHPSKDGYSIDHYSQMKNFTADDGVGQHPETDNGGVHGSSGIMNNAFYLMSQGGKNPVSGQGVSQPMGIEDSLKIFGRAQQYYMTPNTTFAFARESTLRAATDLFGKDSAQVAAVKQAWSAVGVEDAARVS